MPRLGPPGVLPAIGAVPLAVGSAPLAAGAGLAPPAAGFGVEVGVPARVPGLAVVVVFWGVRQPLEPLHVVPAAHQVPLPQQTPSLGTQMPSLHSLGRATVQ